MVLLYNTQDESYDVIFTGTLVTDQSCEVFLNLFTTKQVITLPLKVWTELSETQPRLTSSSSTYN